MKNKILWVVVLSAIVIGLILYVRQFKIANKNLTQITVATTSDQLIGNDMYKNIDTMMPYEGDDSSKNFSRLSSYEKNILEKISALYQEKLNKEQDYKSAEYNKSYYAAKDAHLYYYDKNIAIVTLSGGDPQIYHIASNTISKEQGFWSRERLITSKNYLIALKNNSEIVYFSKLSGTFETIVKPFIMSNDESFYSQCVVEGNCTRDVKLEGDTLVFGIYKRNDVAVKGVYVNTKVREERVLLK